MKKTEMRLLLIEQGDLGFYGWGRTNQLIEDLSWVKIGRGMIDDMWTRVGVFEFSK